MAQKGNQNITVNTEWRIPSFLDPRYFEGQIQRCKDFSTLRTTWLWQIGPRMDSEQVNIHILTCNCFFKQIFKYATNQ